MARVVKTRMQKGVSAKKAQMGKGKMPMENMMMEKSEMKKMVGGNSKQAKPAGKKAGKGKSKGKY